MTKALAQRVLVLRDEVLDLAEVGDTEPPGTEIFDAIIRAIMAHDETSPGLDMTLHDAVSRRLAWGEPEDALLGDAERVCQRLFKACQRSFRNPDEEAIVVELATEVVCTAARIVAQQAVSRAGRERSAGLREELAQRRLREALERQEEEYARLKKMLSDSG